MGCQCCWSCPTFSRANLRRYFLAPASLAESMRRKLDPSRTRLSASDRSSDRHDFSGLVRRRLDLELVFAFAKAASRIGKDCADRSHQARERSEVPAASCLFQRIGCSPGRFKKAVGPRRAPSAETQRCLALAPGRHPCFRADRRLAGRPEIPCRLRREIFPESCADGAVRLRNANAAIRDRDQTTRILSRPDQSNATCGHRDAGTHPRR